MDDLKKELASLRLDHEPPRSRRGAWSVIALLSPRARSSVGAAACGCSTAAAADDLRPAAGVYHMSSGRLVAIVAPRVGVIGVVIGGLAVAHSRRTGRSED